MEPLISESMRWVYVASLHPALTCSAALGTLLGLSLWLRSQLASSTIVGPASSAADPIQIASAGVVTVTDGAVERLA